MKRILLFSLSLVASAGLFAQSFQIMDHNDVDITNTTHYEYGTPSDLALTKFHVKNLTGTNKNFAVRTILQYTPYSNSDLAICFGTACYSASGNDYTMQTINSGSGDAVAANATYNDLKVAPLTWMWNAPATDSVVWRVVIFDQNAPTDSASAIIVWRDNSAVSVEELTENDVEISAYPNPASGSDVTVTYDVAKNVDHAEIVMYDLVGKELNSYVLNTNENKLKLNVSDLNSGVYFYAIKVNKKILKTERLIVK